VRVAYLFVVKADAETSYALVNAATLDEAFVHANVDFHERAW
jgi:hypothetical protein